MKSVAVKIEFPGLLGENLRKGRGMRVLREGDSILEYSNSPQLKGIKETGNKSGGSTPDCPFLPSPFSFTNAHFSSCLCNWPTAERRTTRQKSRGVSGRDQSMTNETGEGFPGLFYPERKNN